jgi:hypothetical protein
MPAFIVEGQMEQRLLGRICPGNPIRRIGCNGDHVEIERVCDFIETHIRLLGNRHHPIFVIFDREKREAGAEAIMDDVQRILEHRGFGDQDIRVFVADREAEDWLLKDTESICGLYDIPLPEVAPRGKAGLARLLKGRVDYHETTVGVELFLAVSKRRVSERCHVFAKMRTAGLEIGCAFFEPDLLE